MAHAARPPTTPLAIVWRSPFYRAAIASLFLAGVGTSAMAPQLTLFFVDDLGASLSLAGLYYLTNLAAPVVGFLIGRLSDQRPDRLPLLRGCAVVGTVGWLTMAAATEMWMAFAVSVAALSVSGATGALLFAAARDELSRKPTDADNRIMSTVRMAYTAGWVAGPLWGSWFGGVFGLRALLVSTAAFTLAQLLPLVGIRVNRYVAAVPASDPAPGRRGAAGRDLRAMVPLFTFAGLCALAICGDAIKFSFLPIYMADDLGASDTVRGAVIAIQPACELLLIPLFGLLADRFGAHRLVIAGATMGVAANLAYATSSGVAGLFLGQILMAGLWAAMAGLGVSVAQRLYPQGVGVASTAFFSSLAVASTLGGLIGSAGVSRLGLPDLFFVPAVLCAVGVGGMLLLAPSLTRGEPSPLPLAN
jgi:SET family sugar efflux transporter-like MFS transporter